MNSFMLFFFTLLFESHQHPLQLRVKLVFSYLCTNDLYGLVCNAFDACRSKTRASAWEEVGPNLLPLAQIMDLHTSKIITHRDVKIIGA